MKVRSQKLAVTPAMVDVLLEGTDRVREMLDNVDQADDVDLRSVYSGLEPFLAAEGTAAAAPAIEAPAPADAEPAARKTSGFIPLAPRPRAPEAEVLNPVPPPRAEPSPAPGDTAAAAAQDGIHAARGSGPETLRVRVDLLNDLMNLAGELVLARNQLVQSLDRKLDESLGGGACFRTAVDAAVTAAARRLAAILADPAARPTAGAEGPGLAPLLERELAGLAQDVQQALPARVGDLPGMNATVVNLDTVTTNLQENIMRTRMQAVDALFGKLPRQVRQLAKQVGKDVELVLQGNEVELDKSIIEALSDPLNHLIRNSLDHGFEGADEREKAGKPRTCRLAVRAFHEGGQVNIEIEDDGRGIDPDVIRAKAVEKGVIGQAEADALDDRAALMLIFAPGFSTAAQVSDISGRGVGMDVVRTNIENLGGGIDVDSARGRGTRMRLNLPLTLAIIPSLLVRAGGRRFAVPQVSLDELVRLRGDRGGLRVERVEDAEVLRLRGDLLPLLRLNERLGLPDRGGSVDHDLVLVLKLGEHRYGLVVDEVLDTEEIVVKPLPAALKSSRAYAGATIMGDGSVAMILDVLGIAEEADLRFDGAREAQVSVEQSESYLERTESQTLLLFRNEPAGEQFALNLSLISRIEKIDPADIQTVAGGEFLEQRGRSLRLLRLHDHLPVPAPAGRPAETYVIIPKLVKHPLGIVAHVCEDVVTTRSEVDRDDVRAPGVLGTGLIGGELTLFLDIYGLFEAAAPDLYRAGSPHGDPAAGARVLLAEDTSFFRAVEKQYLEAMGSG